MTINHLHGFSDQAARFATRREDHARTRVNIDRAVDDIRNTYVPLAVEFIVSGWTHAAEELMAECLAAQASVAKIRALEVVR